MAKVKAPLFSQEAHGALAGIEYRVSTYGHVVGRRSISPATRSSAQLSQRGRLARAQRSWTTLTGPSQLLWDSIATPPDTGRNAYIRAFTRLDKIAEIPHAEPTPTIPYASINGLTFQGWSGTPPFAIWSWIPDGNLEAWLMWYWQGTWSHRSAPTLAKLRFTGYAAIGEFLGIAQTNFAAPVNWFRWEIIDPGQGAIIQSGLIRVDYP